jgi:hypothetical protein
MVFAEVQRKPGNGKLAFEIVDRAAAIDARQCCAERDRKNSFDMLVLIIVKKGQGDNRSGNMFGENPADTDQI